MPREPIVAVALLTQRNLDLLGSALAHVWPVEDAPDFDELLRKIDETERELERPAEQHAG